MGNAPKVLLSGKPGWFKPLQFAIPCAGKTIPGSFSDPSQTSNAVSRLASGTVMPPNLLLQV
jgi:hypothetical protein